MPRVNEKSAIMAIQASREEGRLEGLDQGRQEILEWLKMTYLDDPGRPDRGTPKAEAILELARDATKYIEKKRGK